MSNNEKTVAIKNWFGDEEIMSQVKEMKEQEMKDLFLELSNMKHWIAIIRYAQNCMEVAQNGLITIDPSKEPTDIARLQGIYSGILGLPNAVGQLVLAAQKVETPTDGK